MNAEKSNVLELKTFCENAFEWERLRLIPQISKKSIKITISKRKIAWNGSTRILSLFGKDSFHIYINVVPVLNDSSMSNEMKKFYIYNTVVHELMHIKLIVDLKENKPINYLEMFSGWDQLFRGELFSPSNVLQNNQILSQKRVRKRDYITPSEYCCIAAGITQAYATLKDSLSSDEIKLIDSYIESLLLIQDTFEISYRRDGFPFNLFTSTLKHMQKYIRNRKKSFETFPVLLQIFHSNGTPKTAKEILQCIENKENDRFYRKLLLHYFINVDFDWATAFQESPNMKSTVEELANDYCKRGLNCIKSADICTLFIPEFVIQDNISMLIKSMTCLRRKMTQYQMKIDSGGVIPLYAGS